MVDIWMRGRFLEMLVVLYALLSALERRINHRETEIKVNA